MDTTKWAQIGSYRQYRFGLNAVQVDGGWHGESDVWAPVEPGKQPTIERRRTVVLSSTREAALERARVLAMDNIAYLWDTQGKSKRPSDERTWS